MREQMICWVTCVLGLLVVSTGCVDRDLGVLEPRVGRAIDMPVNSDGIADVDLLLVIDDSTSMSEEQELLEREIPSLVRGLTSPPDEDGDGEPDWTAVESLRVAVVTTDMGTNGVNTSELGGCGLESSLRDPYGADGALRQDVACDPSASLVQRWQTGDDVDAFVDRVGCVANAGTRGCGFEQPLAAGARALSRTLETGFPRENALLAVLVLSDEEDCSVADANAFYADLPRTGTTTERLIALNRYCVNNSFLHDAADLARDLSAGRDASRFLFGAITGIPVDLAGESPSTILRDTRMEPVFDDTVRGGIRYACRAANPDGSDRSVATPATRIVEVASHIEGALVRSICEDDFRPAIAELTRRIGRKLEGVCLARGLSPSDDGSVDCVVEETLPEGMRCEDVPGRTSIGADPRTGRARCEITQVPSGVGSGWTYESIDDCDEIRFSADAIPPLGASLRFQCLVEVPTTDPVGL